jgi:FAD/FMN-containing dehydrogenase
MSNFVTQPVSGWGRFPVEPSPVRHADRRSDPARWLADPAFSSHLARGLGRSYGDTAMNGAGALIDVSGLNRFLSFDPATGVLHAEAGASFAEIIRTFLPQGFFLPVTPGTKHVTLGGAIANDVHGKNHHRDGALSRFVDEIELALPSGQVITCSPSEHADVFWATCNPSLGL